LKSEPLLLSFIILESVQGNGGETCGKEPLGRPRRRWDDNIKMDLQEVGWEGMDCIDLA
jgi:hypothetical protein